MTIDTHFEVILERITQLSNITKTTVWYEIHPDDNGAKVLVLINDSNDIGAIVLMYVDQMPERSGFMFGKDIYDTLVKDGFIPSSMENDKPGMEKMLPEDVVSTITKYNQSA